MGTEYFTSKWIMTLFASFLPPDIMPQILDNFFLDGWASIYRIAIAVLKLIEPEIMEMDMIELSKFFRETARN